MPDARSLSIARTAASVFPKMPNKPSLPQPKGRYSYTHYDRYGRPTESGEFIPNDAGIGFNTAQMTDILEKVTDIEPEADGGLPASGGTKVDWTKTRYDTPEPNLTAQTGLADYTQAFVYGGVSYTENPHQQV
jgi:hypothetical protein